MFIIFNRKHCLTNVGFSDKAKCGFKTKRVINPRNTGQTFTLDAPVLFCRGCSIKSPINVRNWKISEIRDDL